MAKVFIVNDTGHDYSDAERFGELVVLSEGTVNKYSLTSMRRLLGPALADSDPEDYILHSGPSVMSSVASAIFAAKHGRLNLLLYHAERKGRYVARTVVFRKGREKKRKKGGIR